MNRPTPKRTAPALEVPTLDGANWNLVESHPYNFTLLVFIGAYIVLFVKSISNSCKPYCLSLRNAG